MIIFLVEKVSVNCNTYKNGWIYLLVIITIICYLNFTEPVFGMNPNLCLAFIHKTSNTGIRLLVSQVGYLPISLEKLKTENAHLHNMLAKS